jgi:hypothetical protein
MTAQLFRLQAVFDSFRFVQMSLDQIAVSGVGGASIATLTPGQLNINGFKVMGPRLGVRPVTLTDVINAGVTHGWWP